MRNCRGSAERPTGATQTNLMLRSARVARGKPRALARLEAWAAPRLVPHPLGRGLEPLLRVRWASIVQFPERGERQISPPPGDSTRDILLGIAAPLPAMPRSLGAHSSVGRAADS